MSNNKWDSEEFYLRILLVCGPDPEARLSVMQTGYQKWADEVEDYVRSLTSDDSEFLYYNWWQGYYDWLGERDLGWSKEKDYDED